MKLVYTETIPGWNINEVKGLVSGNTIRAKHLGRDIGAAFKNMAGGELKAYTELLAESQSRGHQPHGCRRRHSARARHRERPLHDLDRCRRRSRNVRLRHCRSGGSGAVTGVLIQLVIPLVLILTAAGGRVLIVVAGPTSNVAGPTWPTSPSPPRPTLPGLDEPRHGELVVGSVVMGADYIRQVVGAWRNVFGGEIRSFTPVLDQARAESSLRMLEAAHAKGAVGVVNVRFEAVRINNNASELLSYGTLVY